jgi:hypothetical protein
MKAELTFDLDQPDDRKAHMRCIKSTDMAIVLFEISANMRRQCENWVDSKESVTPQEVIDYIFNQIEYEMDDQVINISELID